MIRIQIWVTLRGERIEIFRPQWTHVSGLRGLVQSYRRAGCTSIYPVRCK